MRMTRICPLVQNTLMETLIHKKSRSLLVHSLRNPLNFSKSGAILEAWIVAEILKSYWHNGQEAPLPLFPEFQRQGDRSTPVERWNPLSLEIKKPPPPTRKTSVLFPFSESVPSPWAQRAHLPLRTVSSAVGDCPDDSGPRALGQSKAFP